MSNFLIANTMMFLFFQYSFLQSIQKYTVSRAAIDNPTEALNRIKQASSHMMKALDDICPSFSMR